MARISGVDLPKNKRIEIALTYIYGIGRTSANKILAETGINPDTRVKDLTEQDEAALRDVIGHGYMVEGDLRRNVAMDIKRLTEIGCYRGLRHRKGLPVRRPYPLFLQQHHGHCDRYQRQCPVLGFRRWPGLPRLQKVHPLCSPDCGRDRSQGGH